VTIKINGTEQILGFLVDAILLLLGNGTVFGFLIAAPKRIN
jgi:hypothetical protein